MLLPKMSNKEREVMFMETCRAANQEEINKLKDVWVKRVCPESGREYYVCAFKTAKENGGRSQQAASRWDNPFEKLEEGVGFELSERMFADLLLHNGVSIYTRGGGGGAREEGLVSRDWVTECACMLECGGGARVRMLERQRDWLFFARH